jgi:uncharacterized protein YkwD
LDFARKFHILKKKAMKKILLVISLVSFSINAQKSFTSLSELRSMYYQDQITCNSYEQQKLIKNYIEVDSVNEKTLNRINYLRSLVKNNKLMLDSAACVYAKNYARQMTETGIFQHSNYHNTIYNCENILYIDRHIKSPVLQSLPAEIVSVWANSPGHAVGLNYPAKKAGLGIAYKIIDDCTIRIYAVYVSTEKI